MDPAVAAAAAVAADRTAVLAVVLHHQRERLLDWDREFDPVDQDGRDHPVHDQTRDLLEPPDRLAEHHALEGHYRAGERAVAEAAPECCVADRLN